ncbi:MAG: MBOAT family protein, partial [Cyanobacteria bacterium]|nr:MBOAT family protein [Cyanobacteriota bacterium]
LAFFKYFYLIEDTVLFAAKPFFGELHKLDIKIVLPLAISFFVFEFIHYLVDVYKGKSEPVEDPMAFALFPAFFPTQIAGPIKRVQDFLPQLKVESKFTRENFDQGCYLILNGLFKKVLLADNLALFVTGGFSCPEQFTSLDVWVLAAAFSFQVYFDFSGYADIARGSAQLFGYKVPINFNFPYLSGSISDFWRRWHITLGSWLRDYLYFPLGGSKHGQWRASLNLIITMTLCGLWHGAGWHFVVWGFYHGLLLTAHRGFTHIRELFPRTFTFLDTRLGHMFSVALTFASFCVGITIFRSDNIFVGMQMVKKMFFLTGVYNTEHSLSTIVNINYPLVFSTILWLLPTFWIGQIIVSETIKRFPASSIPQVVRVAYVTAIIFMIVAFAPDSSPRFIYYQF